MSESSTIEWTTRYNPVNPAEIARVEAAWSIRFPADYLAVARQFHGGRPVCNSLGFSQDIIDLPGGDATVFNNLLAFEREDQYHIVRTWGDIFDYLPARVFPFAEDPGGSYFAFDYRAMPDAPTVLFLDHERLDDDGYFTQVPLAATFTDFVALLRHDPKDITENDQ